MYFRYPRVYMHVFVSVCSVRQLECIHICVCCVCTVCVCECMHACVYVCVCVCVCVCVSVALIWDFADIPITDIG